MQVQMWEKRDSSLPPAEMKHCDFSNATFTYVNETLIMMFLFSCKCICTLDKLIQFLVNILNDLISCSKKHNLRCLLLF
jgi:hypothetical protein